MNTLLFEEVNELAKKLMEYLGNIEGETELKKLGNIEGETELKKLVEEKVNAINYFCPYCEYDFGVLDDVGYYFDRIVGNKCPNCNKEILV